MKQTVTLNTFRDSFSHRKDNFSYEGLEALYDYLTEYEENTGEELELDPIALCCDFTEYPSIAECLEEYGLETLEELLDNTTVITFGEGRIIIQDY